MPTPPLDHPSPPEGIGRVVTAMVTPFTADRALDLDGVQVLADHLVATGTETVLVNGTTGESPRCRATRRSRCCGPSRTRWPAGPR
jgi:dihydrodipicolinate synthase/N-acetylneuraminate lyase